MPLSLHKLSVSLRAALFLLGLTGLPLPAADTAQPAISPAPTEIKTWHFDADVDKHGEATLTRGEGIESVISKMGEPRRRSKIKRKDPSRQELGYFRKVSGPLLQKQVTAKDHSYTLRGQLTFTDEITLIFKDGRLQDVKLHRIRSDDVGQESLPPFMR